MPESRLHLINGETLDVAEDPESAARKLWSPLDGLTREKVAPGCATMESDGKLVHVNPDAVLYVEEKPVYRSTVH